MKSLIIQKDKTEYNDYIINNSCLFMNRETDQMFLHDQGLLANIKPAFMQRRLQNYSKAS